MATVRATGIGGVFFRARDPKRLAGWYRAHLGFETFAAPPDTPWWQEAGPTVWAPFPADTDYFGRADQAWMVNFRVSDLTAMIAQLRDAGVEVLDEVQALDGIGRFGWAVDPEGNRFELWEPDPAALRHG